ncbi:hypothetical protein ACFV84_19640 [Kitasatospora sp. NPDC059811]|uniref:hypothetical protein n=1 Tax=Streptomycetaceae TaxID=2062 RepID=UPI00133181E9|nr:hypothetical protein [Streptomyces sp. MJM8645]
MRLTPPSAPPSAPASPAVPAMVQRLPVAGPAGPAVPASAAPPLPGGGAWAPGVAGGGFGGPGAGGESLLRTGSWSWTAPSRDGAGSSSGSSGPARPSTDTARVLQRVAEQAGLHGVPLTAVPARTPVTVQTTASSPPPTAAPPAQPGGGSSTGPTSGADLDELARRLIEPVGRLLRAELRRGRERAGRPYDGRR